VQEFSRLVQVESSVPIAHWLISMAYSPVLTLGDYLIVQNTLARCEYIEQRKMFSRRVNISQLVGFSQMNAAIGFDYGVDGSSKMHV